MYLDDQLTEVFKALAHSLRRSIIDLLSNKPMTTSQLSDHFSSVSRYAVMKHLNMLEKANLIVARKKGRQRFNYFNAVPLQEVKERWLNDYVSLKAGSLLSIKNISENGKGKDIMSGKTTNQSFDIEQEVKIKACKSKIFQALTENIDKWWSERLFDHSEMSIDAKLGGTFVETCGDGKAALWGTITYIVPSTEIWFDGTLGMPGPVKSYYKYKIDEVGESTSILKLSHSVIGPMDPEWEKQYREGWKRLIRDNLKGFLEQN